MKNNILLLVIVGALALSSGFFAGTLYQKSQKVKLNILLPKLFQ